MACSGFFTSHYNSPFEQTTRFRLACFLRACLKSSSAIKTWFHVFVTLKCLCLFFHATKKKIHCRPPKCKKASRILWALNICFPHPSSGLWTREHSEQVHTHRGLKRRKSSYKRCLSISFWGFWWFHSPSKSSRRGPCQAAACFCSLLCTHKGGTLLRYNTLGIYVIHSFFHWIIFSFLR